MANLVNQDPLGTGKDVSRMVASAHCVVGFYMDDIGAIDAPEFMAAGSTKAAHTHQGLVFSTWAVR